MTDLKTRIETFIATYENDKDMQACMPLNEYFVNNIETPVSDYCYETDADFDSAIAESYTYACEISKELSVTLFDL